jgi:hypothetical protein
MNNKKLYFLIFGLIVTSLVINSCKKDKQTSIPSLFTTGYWELGSIQVYHYIGDSQISVDTLTCNQAQLFTFKPDMTCTYTNFDCNVQTASGKWSLSDTKLYLSSDITLKDTTIVDKKTVISNIQPFSNAHIINIGDFSLVLETGDIQLYYTATQPRTIMRYGFIRQRPDSTN